MYHVSRFGIFISVAFYALLHVPMFVTFSLYLFSLYPVTYFYSLRGEIVFRWSPFYLCQYMSLNPNQALKI